MPLCKYCHKFFARLGRHTAACQRRREEQEEQTQERKRQLEAIRHEQEEFADELARFANEYPRIAKLLDTLIILDQEGNSHPSGIGGYLDDITSIVNS